MSLAKQTIKFWCPETQKNVVCDCEVTETGMVSIQVAVPKVCLEMRKHGCTLWKKSNCLVEKEIQGNFGLELEAS